MVGKEVANSCSWEGYAPLGLRQPGVNTDRHEKIPQFSAEVAKLIPSKPLASIEGMSGGAGQSLAQNGRCERTGFRVGEYHTTKRDPRSRLEAQSPKQFPSSALDRKSIVLVVGLLVGRDGLSIARGGCLRSALKIFAMRTGAFGTAKQVIKSRTGTAGGSGH